MKPTTPPRILLYFGSSLIWLTIFQRPLGLSDSLALFFGIASVSLMLMGTLLLKRAKKPGLIASPVETDSAYRKRLLTFAICAIVCSLISPILFYYNAPELPLLVVILISITGPLVGFIIFYLAARRHRPKE